MMARMRRAATARVMRWRSSYGKAVDYNLHVHVVCPCPVYVLDECLVTCECKRDTCAAGAAVC